MKSPISTRAAPSAIRPWRRHLLLLAWPLLLSPASVVQAQVSVQLGFDIPGVSLGIELPIYPDLQRIPGYPVYYAPQAQGNYFYYEGMYWVLKDDDWYASSWYNGPWRRIARLEVPVYLLRVPVRYYRQPPAYFSGWRADAPPRWDLHWGRDWHLGRPGWDRWDRRAMPASAPLPVYQRRYPQSRYPSEPTMQHEIRHDNFRFRPRDPVARQAYDEPARPTPRPPRKPPRSEPEQPPMSQPGKAPANAESDVGTRGR